MSVVGTCREVSLRYTHIYCQTCTFTPFPLYTVRSMHNLKTRFMDIDVGAEGLCILVQSYSVNMNLIVHTIFMIHRDNGKELGLG
jgi:hypothetical protein